MRRPILWVGLALLVAVIAIADITAAGIVLVGLVALALAVRYRGKRSLRITLISLTVGVMGVGIVAALAVPQYLAGRDPLLVTSQAATQAVPRSQGFELNGFVISDNDNAANAVDAQAGSLTTVTPTGGFVARDGSFQYVGVRNALIHAHLNGARADLLIQNYDVNANGGAGAFSPDLAHAAVGTPDARAAFASQVANLVRAEQWDGIAIDFELVAKADQPALVALLDQLRTALPKGTRLAVAVPAPDPADGASLVYDLAALGRAADVLEVMTYDLHTSSGDSGPIATPTWVKSMLQTVLASVPASKVQVGIPGYGYVWGPSAAKLGQDGISVSTARSAVAEDHATPTWNASMGEWTATLHDGSVLWWSDEQSMKALVQVAREMKVQGAAVWELAESDPMAPLAASVPLLRGTVTVNSSRGIERVNAAGLVALTFDDGPDPTWTPQVLEVLRSKGVPGTFFDIGMNALHNPSLVEQEVSQGGVVADHTYSHLDLTEIPQWRARLEIAAGQWVIHGITGRTPTLFRSPYGAAELADTQSATHRDLATALGMQPVGWNVDPYDWAQPGVAQIVATVTSAQGRNLVVLLHDGGGDRSQTVAALPGIIDGLRARGYQFVTVDQLDGTLTSPYTDPPSGPVAISEALVSIASYRLWTSSHVVVVWAMLALGLLSVLRILVSWPLAVVHRRRQRRRRTPNIRESRTVTVLIPAHNEEATLAKTLESLAHVRGPIVEIVVAENGSTDATAEVGRAVAARLPHLPIDVRELGPVGKAAALNACLPQTRGDVIVVLDADTVLDPAFVESVLPWFEDPSVGAVAGNVKVGNRRRLLPKLQSLEYVMSLALDRRAQAVLNVVSVVPGAAGAFRRDAVVRVGGWPSRTLTEDTDLTVAILTAGWQVPYAADAISWTEAPETVSDVLKQRRRWSYGAAQVSAIHGGRLLDAREGRVGLIALPWLFVAQVLLPAAGPIVDFFLLWLLLNGDWSPAAGMLALAIAAEVMLAAWALRTDGESLRHLWLVPIARVVWRPLLLLAVAGSLRKWLLGQSVHWRKARRRNTVAVPAS